MTRVRALCAALLTILFMFSCSMDTSVFTQEELDSMFTVAVGQSGRTIATATPLDASKPLDLSVEVVTGSTTLASIKVSILSVGGNVVAVTRYVDRKYYKPANKKTMAIEVPAESGALTGSADPQTSRSAAVVVETLVALDSLKGDLPQLKLPEKIPDGYYLMKTEMLDDAGDLLSSSATPFLIYRAETPILQLSMHPAQLRVGKAALFKVVADSELPSTAWIRWLVDNELVFEGLAKDRFDRFIWSAPAYQGVHEIRAELFPFRPAELLAGVQLEALASSSLKSPVTGNLSPVAGSETPSMIWSVDLAPAQKPAQAGASTAVKSIGSPAYPESFSAGFGFVYGAGRGLEYAKSALPLSSKEFSVAFSLAPLVTVPAQSRTGLLLTLTDPSGASLGAFGVAEGVPYFETSERVSATKALGSEYALLVFNFQRVEKDWAIAVFLNGKRVGFGHVPAIPSEVNGLRTTFAGKNGYPAVYGAINVFSGLGHAYSDAMLLALSDAFVSALSFDPMEAAYPGYSIAGPSQIFGSSLLCAEGTALRLDVPEKNPVRLAITGPTALPDLVIEIGETVLCSISASGTVSVSGNEIGTLARLYSGAAVRMGLDRGLETLSITDESDADPVIVPIPPQLAGKLRVSLKAGSLSPLLVSSVLFSSVQK